MLCPALWGEAATGAPALPGTAQHQVQNGEDAWISILELLITSTCPVTMNFHLHFLPKDNCEKALGLNSLCGG